MIQRFALFIGTALVGGLGYLALNKNDADHDADDSDEDESTEESEKKGGGSGSGIGSWWDNFTSSDDADSAEEAPSLSKPTRRRMGGSANKSKKQRPVAARKTRVSRK
jgi:hypothetical protein